MYSSVVPTPKKCRIASSFIRQQFCSRTSSVEEPWASDVFNNSSVEKHKRKILERAKINSTMNDFTPQEVEKEKATLYQMQLPLSAADKQRMIKNVNPVPSTATVDHFSSPKLFSAADKRRAAAAKTSKQGLYEFAPPPSAADKFRGGRASGEITLTPYPYVAPKLMTSASASTSVVANHSAVEAASPSTYASSGKMMLAVLAGSAAGLMWLLPPGIFVVEAGTGVLAADALPVPTSASTGVEVPLWLPPHTTN